MGNILDKAPALLCSTLVLACTTTVSARPLCLSAASDPDGDGFGWENNMTCVVSAAPANQRPVCQSASSDPDGDGYGWENGASCDVATSNQTTTNPTTTTPTSRPLCSSSSSDPDGDGFGWENNATCVVSTGTSNPTTPLAEETVHLTLPACSDDKFDPDGDGFGWENSTSCTFLNAGDGGSSITDVILVTGQSNALGAETGRLDPDSYVPTLDSPVQRVYAFSENGWGIAGLQQIWDLNWYPRGDIAGPPANNFGFHFGKTLVQTEPDSVVGIIVITAPGASIDRWESDGDFFAQIDLKVGEALSQLPGNPKVRGVLWHQGESDYYSTDYYSNRLYQLIGDIRSSSWFASNGVFICGETLNSPVNERLMQLNGDGDPRTGCVSSSGLESVGDDIHFNAASLRILGSRYAEKYGSISR